MEKRRRSDAERSKKRRRSDARKDSDKRSRDLKGQLAKQLTLLAPSQKYDRKGNVSAGGVHAGQLGKGALKKAIIDLDQTPCV